MTVVLFNSPGQTNWTCPAGVTSINVEVIGSGAGGTPRAVNGSWGGAGGGSGLVTEQDGRAVTPSNVYVALVGSPGIGGVYNQSEATNGNSSSFGDQDDEIVSDGGVVNGGASGGIGFGGRGENLFGYTGPFGSGAEGSIPAVQGWSGDGNGTGGGGGGGGGGPDLDGCRDGAGGGVGHVKITY